MAKPYTVKDRVVKFQHDYEDAAAELFFDGALDEKSTALVYGMTGLFCGLAIVGITTVARGFVWVAKKLAS